MPAQRPRASFEPIPPDFDLKALVEATPNFSYVDRISCDMIDQQGLPAFEKLVLLHVIIGGKPLVIDGFEDRLDPWTFTPRWLRDNCGDKQELARSLAKKENIPLTIGHYLNHMGMLTNQFFDKPGAYKDTNRQRAYLKDIDCPAVWQDKLREHIPSALFYLNESTGDIGGPGAVPEPNSTVAGRRLGKGTARAGDLMSSLPPDMRAENLMCYIGHEGTYTPAHREMCASLGQNIMVDASTTVSADDGKAEKPGSSIWFMTESKDRHMVSEYWLSVLGHDIEVENHFAQVVAWKKAPFNVYVVEQRPGDFILIPPLAPHQVWNRGTRTMKVAWNRTTIETLEMALNEALPRSRIVCRDEQYKNKAIVYYTLQKYSSLLSLAQNQAGGLPADAAQQLLSAPKIKQVAKDFRRLFNLYKQILLSEMFGDDRETPKGIEYLPFDSNVTCAYCRGNIFNRFLTCPSCKDMLGQNLGGDGEGDPYDVCLDCYAMGRSCACISGLKWVEQFRWKELAAKYDAWRKLIISIDGGVVQGRTPGTLIEERRAYGKKTLAEVCRDQLKRRPWKDVHKPSQEQNEEDEEEEEEIVVNDDGMVKKIQKKRSKAWLKNNSSCHVCKERHPNWKMAQCTKCERWWCYGTLFRGWDKMPIDVMQDTAWECPHCLAICFAGSCKRDGKHTPYEPKGTLLGHDTRKVADARSVEALVDFSVSNLNWLKEDDPVNRAESRRLKRAGVEAQRAKAVEPSLDADEDGEDGVQFQDNDSPTPPIDPALGGNGYGDDEALAMRLQQANSVLQAPAAVMAGVRANGSQAPDGYVSVDHAGYVPPPANMYPQPDDAGGYSYPGYSAPSVDEEADGLRPFKRRRNEDDDADEDINMQKQPKTKKARLSAAGFRSSDLATTADSSMGRKSKSEAQREFEREKEKRALEKAKAEGRFIMLQAALKGKHRVVKLRIDPQRLAQLVAQQAVKAALEEQDAEHEVENEDSAAQQLEEELEEDADTVLLKSDIQPKKRQDPKAYYQQRQRDGLVLTGTTKKALIPVEKDENYGYRAPQPKPKSAAGGFGATAGANDKRKRARKSNTVEYEEVDIGSEDEGTVAGGMAESTPQSRGKEKRSLPSYLRTRYQDDGEEYPDELPEPQKKAFAGTSKAASAKPKGKAKPITGKRPSFRPSTSKIVTFDAAQDDAEAQEMINATANGDFLDVNEIMGQTDGPSNSASSFAAVNHPNGSARSPASHKSTNMQEQNRLAKLQALEMVTGESNPRTKQRSRPNGKTGLVSMADAADSDESDDDGPEEVPARRSVRA